MMKLITRIVAILFVLAFTYVGASFTSGVGDVLNITVILFSLILGTMLQLGLFLSTYSNKSWKLVVTSAILMIPFFLIIIASVFSPNFLNKITGSPIQTTYSIALISGSIIYLYTFYKLFIVKYNKALKQGREKASR